MNCCVRLKSLNTFKINISAYGLFVIHTEAMLIEFWKKKYNRDCPLLILGEGSNVLFLENYFGVIILNRIRGIFIKETKSAWLIHVCAGEKWKVLVNYMLDNNIPGLENLAYIPGYVGAAPIQNIGAYGVELSEVCEYVDIVNLHNGKKIRLTCKECDFSYRSSVFQKDFRSGYMIVSVGLKLKKRWVPVLKHKVLKHFDKYTVTPKQIRHTIYITRKKKLPDPNINGNAGSFFKNPIIDYGEKTHSLLKKYSNMPFYYYKKENKVKLSAAWLIQQCQLTGRVFGTASVYCKQPLVLINNNQTAIGTEIAALALYICKKVFNKFDIWLKPEVRLIGKFGEIDSKKLFWI